MSSNRSKRNVLVTGANGYIGQAVARAFQKAGYTTYGLIRSSSSRAELLKYSIIPIIGSAAGRQDVLSAMSAYTAALDVIVSTTEDRNDYIPHFNDTMMLLRALAEVSITKGTRPLVLFTSGCKDYGQSGLDGSPDLQFHTESFPPQPPNFLADRATYAIKVLQEDSFDPVVLRPTHVYGGSSSLLAQFFQMAEEAKGHDKALYFKADRRTIIHSLNVHDCAAAYVALATHPDRAQVTGECFNISPDRRYETLGDIADALVRLYGIQQGVEFEPPGTTFINATNALVNFSQYVDSQKLRELTGWTDHRPMFAQDLARYKREYDSETAS